VGRKLKQAKLEYHKDASKPANERIVDNPELDDPLSPAFVDLRERSPVGQARWWAMQEKRKNARGAAGVFDG